MAALLAGFLERCANQGFAYDGARDCALFPADWALIVTGRDPAASWRGRYHDARGALALLKDEGGMEAAFARGCAEAGLAPCASPGDGDIALVVRPFTARRRLVGAIALNGRFLMRARAGLIAAHTPFVRAWSLAPWLAPSIGFTRPSSRS